MQTSAFPIMSLVLD